MSGFDYSGTSNSTATTPPSITSQEMYENVNQLNLADWIDTASIFICIFIATYVSLLIIAWLVEHYHLFGSINLFKIVTLNKGNAVDLTLGRFLIITSALILCCVITLTGGINQLMVKMYILVTTLLNSIIAIF